MRRIPSLAVWCWLVGAAAADAQVTISAGPEWLGGHPIGTSTAELRTNAPGADPPPFTLFSVDSRIAPSAAGELRVGVQITSGLTIEGGAAFARRRVPFSISRDPEAASQEFEGESLQDYVFDAGLAWDLPQPRRARLRTFVLGGAGYLRQLHQDRMLVESGQLYYVGGGARYWLWHRPGSARSFGVRGDLRLNVRRDGIDFETKARLSPSFSLLLFVAL